MTLINDRNVKNLINNNDTSVSSGNYCRFWELVSKGCENLDKGWMLIMAPLLMMGLPACFNGSFCLFHAHLRTLLNIAAYSPSLTIITFSVWTFIRCHTGTTTTTIVIIITVLLGRRRTCTGRATKWWWVALNVDSQWGSAVSKQASAQLERAIIGIFDRIKVENYSHLLYDNGIAGIVEYNSSPGEAGSRGRNVTPPSTLTTYPDEEVGMSYPWVPRI